MYLLKVHHIKQGVTHFEVKREDIRIFSEKDKAEQWLTHNGFIYGQRDFFNYPTNDKEWFRQDEKMQDRIDVVLEEIKVDDESAISLSF